MFWERLFSHSLVLVFASVLVVRPSMVPAVALAALLLSLAPLFLAWQSSRGLAIRPVVSWAFAAVCLGLISQGFALSEPLALGRPIAGHWAYLSTLATFAALISALGARKPGGGAWAILMGLLVLVLLIPWLEGSGLKNGSGGLDRLSIDAPWSIFYGLLVVAGISNYLPTVFGRASCLVGASLIAEFVGLYQTEWTASRRALIWSVSPFLLGIGINQALADFRRRSHVEPGLPSLWFWFRDLWGVVWALRVKERFQRTSQMAGWPISLTWNGPTALDGSPLSTTPAEATKTLETLLRRFADASRLAEAQAGRESGACSSGRSSPE